MIYDDEIEEKLKDCTDDAFFSGYLIGAASASLAWVLAWFLGFL
jgi:hypothetical protein